LVQGVSARAEATPNAGSGDPLAARRT